MPTIIENRRNLHQIPEIELTTQKTAQYIENVLDLYDCTIDHPIQNSVTAYFNNQKEKTIVFRSDMDALPMEENTDLEFKSTNGCMHACGHDGHMAMVLELAKYAKESDYNVLLLFQPGEEKPGGAKPIIESKFFDKFNIAAIYGTHIYPELEKGKVYTRPNEMMAGGCEFELLVKGKASHAAQPQNGINALTACVEILQKSLEQEEKAFDNNTFHLLHFGTFHSGQASNIIADQAHVRGSIRYYDPRVFDQIVDIIEQNMNNAIKKYKVQVNFKVNHHYPPVFNNEELFYALYKNNLVNKLESPVLISEDFGYYRNVAPSIFFFLGTGDTIPLHSNKFTFDEDILYKGVELYRKLLTTKIPF